MCRLLLTTLCLVSVAFSPLFADESNGRLDIYFIDVEGGAATLFVTPNGETMLIDSGYPDYGGRDRDRILDVLKNVVGKDHLDHAAVTHWHLDHYGNHASLASEIKINTFWDRGIPDDLQEDPKFLERIADYRRASQNESKKLNAGDVMKFKSKTAPLNIKIATASREVIPNTGNPNPHADRHEPRDTDKTDNAASVSFLVSFGDFKFLCCGDLTWNIEGKLVTPNNPLGKVDMYMVTHHGLPTSNNPALVLAVDPIVAVMCNGPTKGGHEQTQKTLREVKSLKHLYQLHRNIKLDADQQTPAEFIANDATTQDCKGIWVKASVAPDGGSYTVQIGPEGKVRTYQTRDDHE